MDNIEHFTNKAYRGFIAQSVRASEQNSVVVGLSPTQANFQ